MKEAFYKAIMPSCIFALFGIPFALIGSLFFLCIGLVVFTLGFYFYGSIKKKKLLSEEETIEMCKEYLDKTTDFMNNNIDYSSSKKEILKLKNTIYDDTNNALIYEYVFDSTKSDIDISSEYKNSLERILAKNDLESNKEFIACVYLGASFIAQIRDYKAGRRFDVSITSNEMKTILSTWHTFGSEYSWL